MPQPREPQPAGDPAPAGDPRPRPPATDAVAEVGRRLEAAYREVDLDRFRSLLHPDVRWGDPEWGCTNRDQVLAWYRRLLAAGAEGTVATVEVDGDAVVVGVVWTRPAEGDQPAPAEERWQVFRVEGDRVVEILGYPDREAALARA